MAARVVTACLFLSVLVVGNCKIWQRSATLDKEAQVYLWWNITNGGWLDMEVFAPTKGYIGIGISPNGAMRGSDMALGWVDGNGKGHIKDMHGVGNLMPKLDAVQDYTLVEASEDDLGTRLWFRRLLHTCDDQDIAITNDTLRIIWALGDTDPEMLDENRIFFNYHGTRNRGVKSMYVVENPLRKPFPDQLEVTDPDINYFDFRMDNALVSEDETVYLCKIVRFPKLDRKHHMIGYRPLIETPKNVHHMVLYECVMPKEHGETATVFEPHTMNQGSKCYTPNMPEEWSKYCVTFFTTWVSGSEGEMLPDHVGSPVGEEFDGATFYMFEVHYDNPERETFRDSSGLRIFYTDKLRAYDSNVMLASYRITPFLVIPPQQEQFVTYGICSSECTQKGLPEGGIKLIYVLFHAHLGGRNFKLRHFRNGVELPLIAEDKSYDFNYQQPRLLSEEVTVLPGDELVTECGYETMDRNRSVVGGLSTKQEMCQSFIMYYPKSSISLCSSQIELNDFFKALGIQEAASKVFEPMNLPYDPTKWPAEKQQFDPPDNAKELENAGDGNSFNDIFDLMQIKEPSHLANLSVGSHMQKLNWSDPVLSKGVEQSWRNGKHYAYCTSHGRKRIALENFVIKYPAYKEPFVQEDKICKIRESLRGSPSLSARSASGASLTLLGTGIAVLCLGRRA